MSGVETKTKQRVTLQESDLGNINPDGVNHQNVAVAAIECCGKLCVCARHISTSTRKRMEIGANVSCASSFAIRMTFCDLILCTGEFLQLHFSNVTALWRGFETFFLSPVVYVVEDCSSAAFHCFPVAIRGNIHRCYYQLLKALAQRELFLSFCASN